MCAYYLAQSGAVFEDPIKADPNWPRVLVIDPESRDQAEAFARAYIENNAFTNTAFAARSRIDQDTILAAVQAAFRAMLTPPKVFAHYPSPDLDEKARVTALCGKVWKPDRYAKDCDRCPECTAIVDAGWVA